MTKTASCSLLLLAWTSWPLLVAAPVVHRRRRRRKRSRRASKLKLLLGVGPRGHRYRRSRCRHRRLRLRRWWSRRCRQSPERRAWAAAAQVEVGARQTIIYTLLFRRSSEMTCISHAAVNLVAAAKGGRRGGWWRWL